LVEARHVLALFGCLGICREIGIFRRKMAAILSRIAVRRRSGERSRGILLAHGLALPVAIGRGGIKANKYEGDGATPRGTFRPVRLWWRADRHPQPRTHLPTRRIGSNDGWCEDPHDRHYNRRISIPKGSAADRLRRKDALYDFIVELDHNTRPRVAGRGSAVFIHVARPGFLPTAGCVALTMPALRRLLVNIGPATRIVVT
jgi:L,D-peptidoglycan transpeptidase YkuD (ErfK/YbiS/YcfS/YnhG family)